MKRTIVCSVIFSAIIIGTVVASITVKRSVKSLTTSLNTALKYCEEENYKSAYFEIEKFEEKWTDKERKFSLLVHREKFEPIELYASTLKKLLENKDYKMFITETKRVIFILENIWYTEKISFYNIMDIRLISFDPS